MDIFINNARCDVVDGAFDTVLQCAFLTGGGSETIGIRLADTANNRAVLRYPKDPLVQSGLPEYKVVLLQDGALVDEGVGVLSENIAEGYEMTVTSRLGEFFGVYQAVMLSQLDLGSEDVGYSTLLERNGTKVFCLEKFRNTAFYSNMPSGFTGLINDLSNGASPKVPCFFVKDILGRISTLTGVQFLGDFYDSAEFAALVLVPQVEVSGTFEVRRLVPNLTISAFLSGLANFLGFVMRPSVRTRKIRMDWGNTIFKSTAAVDWTSKLRKVVGYKTAAKGLQLASELDSSDALNKEAFYSPFMDTGTKISTPFSGIMANGDGLLEVKQPALTATQPDKVFAPRLAYFSGSGNLVNFFNGVVLRWHGADGLAQHYWQGRRRFEGDGFRVDNAMYCQPHEIAWLGAAMRGEVAEPPVVHLHGANYLIERAVVAGDKKGLVKIKGRLI